MKINSVVLIASLALLTTNSFAQAQETGLELYQSKMYAEALPLLEQQSEAGDAEAAYALGEMNMSGEHLPLNPMDAIKYYELALDRGLMKAGLPLGRLYSSQYVAEIDMPKAVEKLKLAAMDQNGGKSAADAAFFLGQIFIGVNPGITQSRSESFKWLEVAAKNGHVEAAADVGGRYFSGQGVTKDNDKAFKYTEIAALGGHAISQYNLGVYHANGTGTAKNPLQALTWFLVAKDTDPATDNGSIDNFKRGLSNTRIEQAEQRAKRLMRK